MEIEKLKQLLKQLQKRKELGQEPAFATPYIEAEAIRKEQEGMSKRFYAACAAMQGLMSISSRVTDADMIKNDIKLCYAYADELLKQEYE